MQWEPRVAVWDVLHTRIKWKGKNNRKKVKGENHKQRFTKHYTENLGLNETNSIKLSVKKFLHDEKSFRNKISDDQEEFW